MRAIALGAWLLFASDAPAAPLRVVATPSQMLSLSDQMLRRGRIRDAEMILELLGRDPDPDIRIEARFRRAKLESGRGNLTKAAVLLRQIIDEKPSAAPVRLALAQVLDKLGDKDGAWRQLRAIQASGLPPAISHLVDRYSAALRGQRPFGASVELAVAPDTNVNRATRSDTLGTILGNFEIDPQGKAKSGIGLSINAAAYRRVPVDDRINFLFRASTFANLYRQKQFNDVAADVAIGPEITLGRDRLQFELGATQRWFGQEPYLRSARLAGTFWHPVGSRTLVRVMGSSALVDNRLNDLQDGKNFSTQLQIERALTPMTGVGGSLSFDRQALKDPAYSTTSWRAGFTGWQDLSRLTLTATAEIGALHADKRLALFPERREDRYTRLSLAASFRRLQVSGFAPILRVTIERNRSSIAFYDYRRTRTELGIVRAF